MAELNVLGLYFGERAVHVCCVTPLDDVGYQITLKAEILHSTVYNAHQLMEAIRRIVDVGNVGSLGVEGCVVSASSPITPSDSLTCFTEAEARQVARDSGVTSLGPDYMLALGAAILAWERR